MVRELLARRWLAWHAALVVVLVAFTLLGRWQLRSFEDSGASDRSARAEQAVPVGSITTPGGRLTARQVGRKVTAAGRYDGANQLLVPGRRLHGQDGLLVITPLQTSSGIVIVNRGWVATAADVRTRVPTGPVAVTGQVQPSESEGDSRVDPLTPLPQRQVPYVATVRLLNALPYSDEELYDGYVVLASQRPVPRLAPEPVPPRTDDGGVSRWRNLAYALQWWLFAGAAVFFWWSVLRRAAREREEREREDAPAESS